MWRGAPWPAPRSGRFALSTRKGLLVPGAATRLAGLIVLVAVIAAAIMGMVACFRGEAAHHRPARAVSQHARERTVAEGDDAALELPHFAVFITAGFAERQADSDSYVVTVGSSAAGAGRRGHKM